MNDADRETLGFDLQKTTRAPICCAGRSSTYRQIAGLSVVGPGDWHGMEPEQAEQVELQLEVQAKYKGYIERQQREIDKHARQEVADLPADIDYASVTGLSNEARQRLSRPARHARPGLAAGGRHPVDGLAAADSSAKSASSRSA